MEEVLLRTSNLTKVFGKQKAVNQVNVTINKGSIYGFIGRNGAGKTTFLRMVSGLATQTEGEISLFGKTGKDLSSVRKRIGCLIEDKTDGIPSVFIFYIKSIDESGKRW